MDIVWESLRRVRTLRFVAHGSAGTGWTGTGEGDVAVGAPADDALTFTESGVWRPESGGALGFRNVYRWTRREPTHLRLEHLRFGPERPIFLFDLEPDAEGVWISTGSHLCREDHYRAALTLHPGRLTLHWSVDGPRKRERIEYEYGFG